jgi:hypothetical protein
MPWEFVGKSTNYTNQKQEFPVAAMFVNGSKLNEQPLSRTFQGYASYQLSIHLAKRFQRRRLFRNQPIRNKNWLWWPCLLTDRDESSNFYRGHAIDASYYALVHLANQFQMRSFFLKQPIRNKNCLCRPCLLTDHNKMSNHYRGHSKYVSE